MNTEPESSSRAAVLSWIEPALFAAFIFFLSSQQMPAVILSRIPFSHLDKLCHLVEYAVFGIVLHRAVTRTFTIRSAIKLILFVAVIGAFYALTDEIHQGFVALRVSSWKDLVADAAGLFVGAIACAAFSAFRRS